ncbi:MAG: hypothetical protein JW786_06615 [Desulfobacterales bacterium]|nr:hypothetical protein [Desulfobacterales bacterium]
MFKKIVSGGQTVAERAALDTAMKLGILYGGWILKGRMTSEGRLPYKYKLKEMPESSYIKCIERNVIDSDGTLIISYGKLNDRTYDARKMAVKNNRPRLHIDLNQMGAFEAASIINTWLEKYAVKIIHVVGSQADKESNIYDNTIKILEAVFYLRIIKATMGHLIDTQVIETDSQAPQDPLPPGTVEEAVNRLISELSLKDKIAIAGMSAWELGYIHPSLGGYIKKNFELDSGNQILISSCRFLCSKNELNSDEASRLIIKALWKKLIKTHRIRVVK